MYLKGKTYLPRKCSSNVAKGLLKATRVHADGEHRREVGGMKRRASLLEFGLDITSLVVVVCSVLLPPPR